MFGGHVRKAREGLKSRDRKYSVRQVARRIGVEPAYLSKIERGEAPPPSEEKIRRLAAEIGDDPDVLLAMAGKVSRDLQEIILARPRVFPGLLRKLHKTPDTLIRKMIGEKDRKQQ